MLISDQNLLQILQDNQLVDERGIASLQKKAKRSGESLIETVIKEEVVSERNLGLLLGDHLKIPTVNLAEQSVADEVLQLIPEAVATHHKVISYAVDAKGVHVAASFTQPLSLSLRSFLEKKTGQPVVWHIATSGDIGKALSFYTKDLTKAFNELVADSLNQAQGKELEESPIIELVNALIIYALRNRASDILLEPMKKNYLVRLRIDGVLHDLIKLPLELYPQIVSRIKVLSKLRTDEHQAAQDGKISFVFDNDRIDIRVSIVPSVLGETTVMRLLSEESRRYSLSDLGLSNDDLVKIRKAYKKPYGMILATGPTGSGKTTTLYAILKQLNDPEVNISTIEDPVEYNIEGATQIQVNPKTNLTFAKGLRSIVRQDPDVILVGEIRDAETAGIAVNSAMTGHLVLSTIHANDAATTIPRLIGMGVEPFLIASTVNIIVSQRLVRLIHRPCRVTQEISRSELTTAFDDELVTEVFGASKKLTVYKGKGCNVDHETGYEGRIGIYEVMILDDDIRQAIIERKDASTIRDIALKNGMISMIHDGLLKVQQGLTTVEEVVRTTKI